MGPGLGRPTRNWYWGIISGGSGKKVSTRGLCGVGYPAPVTKQDVTSYVIVIGGPYKTCAEHRVQHTPHIEAVDFFPDIDERAIPRVDAVFPGPQHPSLPCSPTTGRSLSTCLTITSTLSNGAKGGETRRSSHAGT